MSKQEIDYQKLSSELQDILNRLDTNDLDVDAAIKQYERGMEIVGQLEDYLKTAENKVKKVKAQWDTLSK
jgi:exodeoxyribonuclease VII small subunit